MASLPLAPWITGLYAVCSVLLLGMAVLVFLRNPRHQLNRRFVLTALSLLAYVSTLFLFNLAREPATLLLVGRLNVAVIPAVTLLGYLFVRAIAFPSNARQAKTPRLGLLLGETSLLSLLTALTPLVDQVERLGMGGGAHTTLYGPLFPLYLVHMLLYLRAALYLAVQAQRRLSHPARDQLALVGLGMLATGAVTLTTNVALPYGLGDFRFIDAGPLSSLLFLIAVGYAILRHRLFDIRVFVRKTLVYGLLLSLALALYAGVVALVTQQVSREGTGPLAQLSVLVIAFAFDPLRRFLEEKTDQLLFGKPGAAGEHRKRRRSGNGQRLG
jgi:hypothetical protein